MWARSRPTSSLLPLVRSVSTWAASGATVFRGLFPARLSRSPWRRASCPKVNVNGAPVSWVDQVFQGGQSLAQRAQPPSLC